MERTINILLSIFFAIAIGFHVIAVIQNDGEPFWWHAIYFITYGTAWRMLFSKIYYRKLIYLLMIIFPFSTHLYYGYKHLSALDFMFWICLIVCLILPLGGVWIYRKQAVYFL